MRDSAARIRDAAIVRFGREGFAVGLRSIAADAGVTAGLVVHYFGSKDGLRRACDHHVLQQLREEKTKAFTDASAAGLMARMTEVDRFVPLVRYILRSLQAGGELAAAFLEQMIADAEEYLAEAEAAGVVRPSRDPVARVRYLAYQNAGGLMLWFALHDDADPASFGPALRRYIEEIAPPALELFTQGLYVDRSMLDDFLMYVPDPPGTDDAADSSGE